MGISNSSSRCCERCTISTTGWLVPKESRVYPRVKSLMYLLLTDILTTSRLAEKFASGELSAKVLIDATYEDLVEKLIAVRGLGLWSVEMFACFTLKRMDVFSTGDLGVQCVLNPAFKGLADILQTRHGCICRPRR